MCTGKPLRRQGMAVIVWGVMLIGSVALAQNWEPIDQLFPEGPSEYACFGEAVAMGDGLLVVGAPMAPENGIWTGAVYCYDIATRQQVAELRAADRRLRCYFGQSVAIDSGLIAVGAPRDDEGGIDSGAVYLFAASSGEQVRKLLPIDGEAYGWCGWSIAMADGMVAAGEPANEAYNSDPGTAYLFDTVSGEQIRELVRDDPELEDRFGYSVAMSGGLVAVGAPWDDDNGTNSGSVYVFDAATGMQTVKLLPDDGAAYDEFGHAVAMAAGYVAVGAPYHDEIDSDSGVVYLFDAASGAQIRKIVASGAYRGAHFGLSVGVSAEAMAAGTFWNNGTYLFETDTGREIAKLRMGLWAERFGTSFAFDEGMLAVGVPVWDSRPDIGCVLLYADMPYGLTLEVENLIGGSQAQLTISGGTSGANVLTFYGFRPGYSHTHMSHDYCASFGIASLDRERIVGRRVLTFDAQGMAAFSVSIPVDAVGRTLYFQSAQQGTCPAEWKSSVVVKTVQ